MTGKIIGTGSYLPEVVWDNHKLTEWLDTSDEWIKERTGISERHIAKDVEPSVMALEAAKKALARNRCRSSLRCTACGRNGRGYKAYSRTGGGLLYPVYQDGKLTEP